MAIVTPCGGCGKMLSVPDEVAGRQARCPACGFVYTVLPCAPESQSTLGTTIPEERFEPTGTNGEGGMPPPPLPPSKPSPPAPTSHLGDVPSITRPPAAAEIPAGQFWMLTVEGKQYGPVDRINLDRWFSEGRVGPGYQIRDSELANWQPAEMFRPQANPFATSQGVSLSHLGKVSAYSKPDQSVMVLAMGILSWCLFCPIFGIVAWMIGSTGLRDMARGTVDQTNRAMMQIGFVLGFAHVILFGILCGGGLTLFIVISALEAVSR